MRNRKLIFLFLNQEICCGYSMRRFFWAPKTYAKIMGKKIFTILRWFFFVYLNLCFNYVCSILPFQSRHQLGCQGNSFWNYTRIVVQVSRSNWTPRAILVLREVHTAQCEIRWWLKKNVFRSPTPWKDFSESAHAALMIAKLEMIRTPISQNRSILIWDNNINYSLTVLERTEYAASRMLKYIS